MWPHYVPAYVLQPCPSCDGCYSNRTDEVTEAGPGHSLERAPQLPEPVGSPEAERPEVETSQGKKGGGGEVAVCTTPLPGPTT